MTTFVRWIIRVLSIVALAFVTSETRAGETNLFGAHMLQPDMVVSPETNGVMELTCKVGFIGGCCFPLTSHDVTASLDSPRGITVVSGPEPLNYAAIEAPVSGTPQVWATFRWRVKRTSPEAGTLLTVTVSSPDSGQVKATCDLMRQSRISIQGPRLPDFLTTGQDLAISVNAESLDQGRYLKSVRFWYSTEIPAGAEQVQVLPDQTGRGIMSYSVAGRQLTAQGQSVDLVRKYEPTVWRGVLPPTMEAPLVGVTVAVDDTGRSASGPVVRLLPPATLTEKFGALWRRLSPGASKKAPGYPEDSSTVVYLFLDRSDASRQLAEKMETYRRAVPHRIHVLAFVEGVTPASLLDSYRGRFQITRLPAVVYDSHAVVDGTNALAVAGTLDHCFRKPSPRLSMELHGGVIAEKQLSVGFIMCNHASRRDAHGSVSAFAFENGMAVGGWRCDRVVRTVMMEGRTYSIPVGKCQPPAMMKWDIPTGVKPTQTGVLTVILDEQGRLIDSICTERPCSRTGICG